MHLLRSISIIPSIVIILCGSLFAFMIRQALELELRYGVAFVFGLILLSLALFFFARLPSLLLYLLVFNIPLAGFEKVLFMTGEPVISPTVGIGVGLLDILLTGFYIYWFYKIFIAKDEPFPRPNRFDLLVLGWLLVNLFSLIVSVNKLYSFFEMIRLIKYSLVYFYVSRHVERHHLKWIVGMLFVTLVTQSLLGIFQAQTGKLLGLGAFKGAIEEGKIDWQFILPGFDRPRAQGTMVSSHGLGIYLGMLLPIALSIMIQPALARRYRWVASAVFLIGVPTIIVTFARGAWLGFGAACLIVLSIYLFWKKWQALWISLLLAICLVPLFLRFGDTIKQRALEAPREIMETRYEYVRMAWQMWKDRPWFGVGVNAYHQAHEEYEIFDLTNLSKKPPVHNIVLFVASQTGLAGLIFFFGLIAATIVRCWKVMRCHDPSLQALALGVLAGLIAEQIEGVTNFVFVLNVQYLLLWFEIGLVAALYRLSRTEVGTRYKEAFNIGERG